MKSKPRIVAAICTYKRNEELARLLDSLLAAAAQTPDVAVGVSIADDNADGRAKEIAETYDQRFDLGVTYILSAAANISIARNHSLDGAHTLDADWIAITDDDCVVPEGWFREHLAVQQAHGADCTTGAMRIRFPEGPDWLQEEPFENFGLLVRPDGERTERAGTNNSIVRGDWLRQHPELRFDPSLGTTGGEDMVFFRTAIESGLHARYAADAPVYQIESAERSTLRYQLSRALWMGNTEAVTNLRTGDSSGVRIALRSGNHARRALWRPLGRLISGRNPQLRYAAASLVRTVGMFLGALRVELEHR